MIYYNDGTTGFWQRADAEAYCREHGIDPQRIAWDLETRRLVVR